MTWTQVYREWSVNNEENSLSNYYITIVLEVKIIYIASDAPKSMRLSEVDHFREFLEQTSWFAIIRSAETAWSSIVRFGSLLERYQSAYTWDKVKEQRKPSTSWNKQRLRVFQTPLCSAIRMIKPHMYTRKLCVMSWFASKKPASILRATRSVPFRQDDREGSSI